jgi:hypothetical protein
MKYNTFLKQFKELLEQTTRYIPPNRRGDGANDMYVDFPYVEDPQPFVTHRPLEQAPAAKPAIDPEAAGEKAVGGEDEAGLPADVPGEDVEGMEPGMDPGMGGDMGGEMPGMGEQEEKLTSSQIGRVYELKKIYSRLSSVESYLSRATDQSILELRKYVSQSIDLFEVVISNYDQYKENVDDIIIQFYEFLDVIYSSIRTYYKSIKD